MTHTHLLEPKLPLMHLWFNSILEEDMTTQKKQHKSHTIMFIISISGLIEMFQNQEITMPSLLRHWK